MSIQFHKYHGLGNDYLVIDPNKTPLEISPDVIRLICHRNFGVGSDGILYGPIVDNDQLSLKIFNPDGSEAEKSGNGIRIFARYLFDAGYVKESIFKLNTLGGEVRVEYLDQKAGRIKVDMGRITFLSQEIPVAGKSREVVEETLVVDGKPFAVTCASVGNPHCVVPMGEISAELAHRFGPLIENHAQFPNRINVQFLKVLSRDTIQIEIWERGAGYTLASGSSSCAAAGAARRLGLVDERINVLMPGGQLQIEIDDQWRARMVGEVTAVSRGELAADLETMIEKKQLPAAMVD